MFLFLSTAKGEDKCHFGSPEEVAEKIMQVLEEVMGHTNRQAQQLRELRFGEYEVAGDMYFVFGYNYIIRYIKYIDTYNETA